MYLKRVAIIILSYIKQLILKWIRQPEFMNFNFIKTLIIKPKIIQEIIAILFVTIYRALSVRILRGSMFTYPKEIRLLAKKIPVNETKSLFSHDNELDQDLFYFKLATGYLKFNDKNSWNINFKL